MAYVAVAKDVSANRTRGTMTPKKRRAVMASIRSKATKPEQRVKRILRALGEPYRSNVVALPGKPDFVLRRKGLLVFVHGCFWHQHTGCRLARVPKSRPDYWPEKLSNNRARDRRIKRTLKRLGWRVITVWECETFDEEKLERLLTRRLFTATPRVY